MTLRTRRVVEAFEWVRWPLAGSPNRYRRPLRCRMYKNRNVAQAEGQKGSRRGDNNRNNAYPALRTRPVRYGIRPSRGLNPLWAQKPSPSSHDHRRG
jgi:hypothetical protein